MRPTLSLQRLEKRDLMSVSAVFSSASGSLTIRGSDANELVDVDGTGVAGEVNVIENSTTPIGSFAGVRSIKLIMGKGNDIVQVSGIAISGNLKFAGGPGSDFLFLGNTPKTGAVLENALFIGGSVLANMGGQLGDSFQWIAEDNRGGTVARNVMISDTTDASIFSEAQGTSGLQATDIFIGGNLKIGLIPAGGDGRFVQLIGLNLFGNLAVKGSAGQDVVVLAENNFLGRVAIDLGKGDDLLILHFGNGSLFQGSTKFNFGSGNDVMSTRGLDSFLSTPKMLGGPESIVDTI